MAEDPGIDQETFDKLVAEGQPERVARARAKAAAARKSRQAEASAGDGAAGGEGSAGGDETPEQVQERVFNELVAEGQPERVARAKAKAAAARAKRSSESEAGPAKQPAASGAKAAAEAPAATAGNGASGGGNGVALTPEQRQQRVAAALAARAEGGPHERTGGVETKYAGQEHTHRLLAMVPPTGIQQIRGKQDDKAYTWPHLLTAEFVCLMAVTAFLFVFSALAPAPLRELANPNVTPNPSKAPWYFLGLQELLRYWHPMVAGVTIPLIIGPLGLIAIPFLDRNPSMRPERRRFAYMLFTMFLVAASALTLSGSFFRGPGFNWTWPWADGIWFTL
jgi:menaquinol-cytochrome c reductase cytochrome b/c subunit